MENLIKLRKDSGKTQQELADYLGVSRQAYANYENDTRKPDFETLLKLAEYFSVTVDWILRGKEQPATFKSDELTFDDFTYALHNEAQKLTNENKQKLLEMAKFFQQQQELAAQPDKEH